MAHWHWRNWKRCPIRPSAYPAAVRAGEQRLGARRGGRWMSFTVMRRNAWYCWWTKSCTTKDDDYPITYRVLTIPGGAGFRPSTVCLEMGRFEPMFNPEIWPETRSFLFYLRWIFALHVDFGCDVFLQPRLPAPLLNLDENIGSLSLIGGKTKLLTWSCEGFNMCIFWDFIQKTVVVYKSPTSKIHIHAYPILPYRKDFFYCITQYP